MKHLAPALLGTFLAASVLASTASAQIARQQLYTRPLPPPRPVLDRLNLRMAWTIYVPMDGRRDGLATVQLHRDDLYVQTRSGLVMLIDAITGVVRWRSRFGSPYRAMHQLAFNSREVYVVNNTYLYALDRRNGAVNWKYRLPEGVSGSPVADETLIYISAPDSRLVAYYLPRPESLRVEETAFQRRDRIVSVQGETMKSTAPISHLTPSALEASTVEETGLRPVRVWEEMTSLRLEHPPLLTADQIAVPTPNGVVAVLNKLPKENGKAAEVYRFPIAAPIVYPAGQFEDIAYIGAEDANLYALQISSEQLRWRFTSGLPISRKPAATEEDVYIVAQKNGMTRLNRDTGETMWRIPVRGRVLENNAAADRFLAANPKYVYATDASGRLLVLERRRGITLSGFAFNDFFFPISNEVTDRLYLAAHSGIVVCLHDRQYVRPIRHRKREEEASNIARIALNRLVTLPGGPEATLRTVLDNWAKKFGITYRVDEQAFHLIGVDAFLDLSVKPPRVDNKPLADALRALLMQVRATFEIVGESVLIVPAAAPAPPPAAAPPPQPPAPPP